MEAGWMSLVVTVAVLAAVALLGRSILRARPRLEAMRRQREWEANRQADREAARRVLERPPEQWPLLDRLPEGVPDRPAYYAARCTLLQERPQGGYASRARGWLVVGRDSLFFHPEEAGEAGRAAAGDAALDIPYTAIERVDSPYVNVLEVIEQDPVTRVWVTHAFRLNRPLVVAAYLSRLAHFELILS